MNLEDLVDQYAELSMEMDRLKAQLQELDKEYKGKNQEITRLLEEAQAVGQKHLEGKKYLVSIKKAANTQTRFAYADAFKLALSKLNKATGKIIMDALEETKKDVYYSASIAVQKKDGVDEQQKASGEDLVNRLEKLSDYYDVFLSHIKKIGQKAGIEDQVSEAKKGDMDWVHINRVGQLNNPEKDTIVGYSKSSKDLNKAPDPKKGANVVMRIEDAKKKGYKIEETKADFKKVLAEILQQELDAFLQEKKMTKGQKRKEKALHKKVPKKPFEKQYGERGEDVYYATMKKQAMKK